MLPIYVYAPHDDGRMYLAEVLDQWRRRDGSWRVVVRYTTAPGYTFLRAEPASRCRALSQQQQDQPDNADAAHHRPNTDHDPLE